MHNIHHSIWVWSLVLVPDSNFLVMAQTIAFLTPSLETWTVSGSAWLWPTALVGMWRVNLQDDSCLSVSASQINKLLKT